MQSTSYAAVRLVEQLTREREVEVLVDGDEPAGGRWNYDDLDTRLSTVA